MLRAKTGVLLWLGWGVIWGTHAASSRDLDARGAREVEIQSTGGEPAFSLKIWAEGRKGVVTVRDEKGTELQSLTCPLLRENPGATQTELATVREQFVTQFVVSDFDFDGHPDLAGIREFGAKWARYCVWLYDPKQHIFVKDFLAEQMELLTNLKPLGAGEISSSHLGPANPWLAVYRIAGGQGSRPERQLVPVYSCLIESAPQGEKPTTVVITRYGGGPAAVERHDAAKMDMKEAFERCDSLK